MQIGSSTVSYRYDPSAAALHITGLVDDAADIECVSRDLTIFLATFPTAQHIRAYVLIDKEELIGRMRRMGFDITAYLPAWYQVARQR